MPTVAISVPNLVTGVSQQPPTLRLATTCKEQINGWSSLVSGLSKRPSTEWVAKLSTLSIPKNASGYIIDRDGSYRYIVVVTGADLKVYDLDGVEQTVSFPYGKSYLFSTSDPKSDYRFVTVRDTTFIVNRTVTVEANDYGEIGENSFTPNGTVNLTSELPASSTVGHIYYVQTTGEFYRWETTVAQPEVIGWVSTSAWDTAYPPEGAEIVETLPAKVTLSKSVYLRRYRENVETQVFNQDTGFMVVEYITVTEYMKFTGQQTSPAVAGASKWVKLVPNQLSKTVFGRVSPHNMGTVHVVNSIANTYYTVYVSGVKKAEYLTPKGVDAASSVPGTDKIAEELYNGLVAAGYTVTRIGSTLSISNLPNGATILGTAGQGDKAIKAYTTTVNQFSDLPPNEINGRIVKVKGAVKDNGDDYYVLYRDGVWEETWGWYEGGAPFNHTMPHALIRNADGTWTFKPWNWEGRFAGDADSNPHPSFIGAKLNDIFIYANRLGFLADENVILSEANNFENFYRTTIATLIDSDPIDFAVLNSGNDILYHSVPFNRDLLLMSDQNQFRLSYQNYLGPKNIQTQFTTNYNVSRDIHPVNIGGSVYFVDDKLTYNHAKLWEYFPRDNNIGDDAEDSSAPVPEYIPSRIAWMASSSRTKVLLLSSTQDPTTVYVYKFYWAEDRKVLNSWSKWTFPDCESVMWGGFTGNFLYLLLKRSDGYHLERMKVDEKVSSEEINSRILLDRLTQKDRLALSYSAGTGQTTITTPWATSVVPEVVASWFDSDPELEDRDVRLEVEKLSDTTFRVNANLISAEIVSVGVPYEFRYSFSPPYVRQQKGQGETVVLDGLRLQLRYITLEYYQTAYFKARIAYPGRDDVYEVFDGKIIGDAEFILGRTPYMSGKTRIAIAGNNNDLVFELINDSPYNSTFGSAEWLATYVPRAGVRV